jgi:hypothetical protein
MLILAALPPRLQNPAISKFNTRKKLALVLALVLVVLIIALAPAIALTPTLARNRTCINTNASINASASTILHKAHLRQERFVQDLHKTLSENVLRKTCFKVRARQGQHRSARLPREQF